MSRYAEPTRVLAEYVVAANAGRDQLDRCRASLRDFAAAAIAGHATPLAARWRAVEAARAGGRAPAGADDAESLAFGAAVRAASTHLTDDAAFGPAGAAVWPAVLALAGPADVIGDAHLEAFAVAVHAATALWRSGRYQEAERGFDGAQVFGTVAAALAGARVLGLGVDDTVSAIAIAASGATGLLANLGSDAGVVAAGAAARAGVRAAQLAAGGLRGSPIALGGRQGFGEAFFGVSNGSLPTLEQELRRTAARGDLVRPRRAPVHAGAQRAVLALARRLEQAPIDEVELVGVAATAPIARFRDPADAAQAAFSARFALARLLDESLPGLLAVPFSEAVGKPPSSNRVRVRIQSRWQGDPGALAPEPRALRLRSAGAWSEIALDEVVLDDVPADTWRLVGDVLEPRAPATAAALRALLAQSVDADTVAVELLAARCEQGRL